MEPPDLTELPQLHAEDLDGPALDDLFRDIGLASRVLEVRVKGAPARHASKLDGREASQSDAGLDAARQAFVAGRIHGLQIRYLFQGRVWCDTLMRTSGGSRLVRIQE